MKIQKHQELIVWQKAMDTAMLVFEITKSSPVEERYSLTDQMRRASVRWRRKFPKPGVVAAIVLRL
jgi:hypothetical protein